MAYVVEHDQRRRRILEAALDVFMEEGFEGATFQKIAYRAGITRTSLYLYFKNKREIFLFSIKQLLQKLENDILRVKGGSEGTVEDKLIAVLEVILRVLVENRRLLLVLQDYLVYVAKAGGDPAVKVRRRVLHLRHILSAFIIEGKQRGEFSRDLEVHAACELLYSLLEAAVFRLTALNRPRVDDLRRPVLLAVRRFRPETGAANLSIL